MSKMATSTKEQSKDTNFTSQEQVFFYYLTEHIATASMVSDATGVPQKNITRYKRKFEKAGRLWEVEKKKCLHTGFKAFYLTTDESKAPQSAQLKLF